MKRIAILILMSVVLTSTALFAAKGTLYTDPRVYCRGRVERIEKVPLGADPSNIEVRIHLQVLDGEFRGQSRIALFRGENDLPGEMFYHAGDRVFIGIAKSEDVDAVEYVSIYDVDNTAGIVVMGLLLVITIILIGRLRGILSMVSLVLTIILIFCVLIPMTLKGYPPLPIAVIISLFSVITSTPVILGLKKKAFAAMAGASLGIILATLLALFSGLLMHLSGIVTDEMITVFYASGVNIDLRGLALSAMVIAATGAIIDVCISIASATEEIFTVHPDISMGAAFRSVFTVSSDILGATVNTLLFAYVGSALPMVLLIAMRLEPDMPFWMVFNYNPILSELIKSAVGCIAMFLSMPLTALVCIRLHGRVKPGQSSVNV